MQVRSGAKIDAEGEIFVNSGVKSGSVWGIVVGLVVGFGLCTAVGMGTFVLRQLSPAALFPAPDSKVEQAYRRSGFGDLLMTSARREAFSNCYKKFVEMRTQKSSAVNLEGRLVYVFQVAEDGKVKSIELAVDEFKDTTLDACVQVEFDGLRFLPPPLGINRHIAHEFTFKKEETFQKEQEARKNKPALELVVPTPAGTAAP